VRFSPLSSLDLFLQGLLDHDIHGWFSMLIPMGL
jgi:hypothetical protein